MPNHYRVSVTTIEKFRRFIAAESSRDTEKALIDTLTGAFIGNHYTYTGQAFHAVVENPANARPARWQGQRFGVVLLTNGDGSTLSVGLPEQVCMAAAAYHRAHPRMFHEIPVGKMYQLQKANLYLGGRMDGIEGFSVRDVKLKFKPMHGPDEYADSIQWRCYLDMLTGKEFYYDVFELQNFEGWPAPQTLLWKTDNPEPVHFLPDVRVKEAESVHCVAYMNLANDVQQCLNDFLEWVDFRNLYHLLKPCDERGFKIPLALPAEQRS